MAIVNVCKNVLSLAIAGWLLGFAAPAAADPVAYVTNIGSGNVSVIATATNTVVATVAVGINPRGVAYGQRQTAPVRLTGTGQQREAPNASQGGERVNEIPTAMRFCAFAYAACPCGQDDKTDDRLHRGGCGDCPQVS